MEKQNAAHSPCAENNIPEESPVSDVHLTLEGVRNHWRVALREPHRTKCRG